MRSYACLLFFLLGWAAPVCAQSPATTASTGRHWEFAGWDGGGCYPNVEFDPNVKDRVYLVSDVAGIWRSDDLGDRWDFITSGLGNLHVSLLSVAPSDSSVLYAGTDDGVFYSQDAGRQWTAADNLSGRIRFSRPESYRSIVVSKTDPSRVIVGTTKGEILYSNHFGKKWWRLGAGRPFEKPGPITALVWQEQENVLYAASEHGLAKFLFQESRWDVLSESPRNITDLIVAPGSPQTLYAVGLNKLSISKDGGAHWTQGPSAPRGSLFRLIVLGPAEKGFIAAWNDGWKGGLVRSESPEAPWQPLIKAMNADAVSDPTRAWAGTDGRTTALKADPFHKDVLFRTDWWGVWRSDDGGVTWNEKIKGAPNSVTSDIAISRSGEIYVATMDNGLLKSADGGTSYRPLFPDRGYAPDVNGHVWRVLLPGKTVYATSTPWNADLNQIIVSDDEGMSFKRFKNGLPSHRPTRNTVWDKGYPRAIAVDPDRQDTVYLGIDGDDDGGFFVSKDGGETWTRPKQQPGSFKIYNALAVDPADPKRLLWGTTGNKSGIYLSENSGQTWRKAAARAGGIFDITFGKGGLAYAAGGEGKHGPVLYVSQDGGRRWKVLKRFGGTGSADALCVLPDGRVALGVSRWHGRTPGKIYLSSLDGKSWEDMNGDLPEGDGPSALAYLEKTKTLYMARYAGSVYRTQIDTP